ncbi:MAG TPA: DNA primase [Mycobacteriales bacterium]|nr:DNA primase [Mycobacteriales bacterium]
MSGRIADADVVRVKELSPIETVIGDYVQLRGAGGGELKGLCPFHDEKSPSFHVTPARGLWHCFGCGEGGDTIAFVRQIEHLSFAEAIEKLAARAGIELTYEQGTASARGHSSQRTRLVEAHKAAVAFFAEKLRTDPAAEIARTFLAERGFELDAAAAYDVGWSPDSWDALTNHLTGKGFSREELLAGGLAKQGQRGAYDSFRGRLMFPIRDNTGDPIGFGARKLLESDTGPKYLNTPETPIYKKSHVLYGLDKARVEIGRRSQAVVVEGYTDVMACHLAGVGTAVATCGTSLTPDHIGLLRRLLMDHDEFRGEVIFTFDGDSAGQRAALKVFEEDQRFVTQTFVAVEKSGLDPCELRLAHGDASVRDLIAARVPLFEFKLRSELDRFDLETVEGRIGALGACAPIVASIRDRSMRPEYARWLAGRLGMDVDEVVRRVGEAAAAGPSTKAHRAGSDVRSAPVEGESVAPSSITRPRPDDPALRSERESVKSLLQVPASAAYDWPNLRPEMFAHPSYRAVLAAIDAAGGVPSGAVDVTSFLAGVRDGAPDDTVRKLVTELAVEPLLCGEPERPAYAVAQLARLQEVALQRQIVELKGRLQRLNPLEESSYNKLFAELIAMEAQARSFRERALSLPTT